MRLGAVGSTPGREGAGSPTELLPQGSRASQQQLSASGPGAPQVLRLPAPPPTILSRKRGERMSETAPGWGRWGFPQALRTCSTWPSPPGKRRPLGWGRVPACSTGTVARAAEGALPGAVCWDSGSGAEGTFLCRRGMQRAPCHGHGLPWTLQGKGSGGLGKTAALEDTDTVHLISTLEGS